jgi:hypothetical protein
MDSAYKASALHKRRTGKGFKLSEEIVKNQEMYEEDDDELPRRSFAFRQSRSMSVSSGATRHPSTNASLEELAAAKLAEQAEVERIFDQQFPGYSACLRSRHFSHPFIFPSTQGNWAPPQPQPQPPVFADASSAPQGPPLYPSSHPVPPVSADEPVSPLILSSSPEPDTPQTATPSPRPPLSLHTATSSCPTIPLQTYGLDTAPLRGGKYTSSISGLGGDDVELMMSNTNTSLKNIDPSLIGVFEDNGNIPTEISDDLLFSTSDPFSFMPPAYSSASFEFLGQDLASFEEPSSATTADSSTSSPRSSSSHGDPSTPLTPVEAGSGYGQHLKTVLEDDSWKDFLSTEGENVLC